MRIRRKWKRRRRKRRKNEVEQNERASKRRLVKEEISEINTTQKREIQLEESVREGNCSYDYHCISYTVT